MLRLIASGLVVALVACNAHPANDKAVDAANVFTRQYEKHDLRAFVAGDDCRVLLIDAKRRLDDGTVESMHYGVGDYEALGGGERFAASRRFRAVVYRDVDRTLWTYGLITPDEARSMPRCR